jgi:hypothetical protein
MTLLRVSSAWARYIWPFIYLNMMNDFAASRGTNELSNDVRCSTSRGSIFLQKSTHHTKSTNDFTTNVVDTLSVQNDGEMGRATLLWYRSGLDLHDRNSVQMVTSRCLAREHHKSNEDSDKQ